MVVWLMPQKRARNITRRKFLKAAGTLSVAAATVGGIDAFLIEPRWIQITSPQVPIPDLPPAWDGVTLAHLSDFHVGRLVGLDLLRKLVRMANHAKPDLIAITGDFVSRLDAITESLANVLGQLHAPEGVFATVGNHDYWTDIAEVRTLLRSSDIKILTNTRRILSRGSQELCIAGVDDLTDGRPDLASALGDVGSHIPRVLLAHNPDYAESMPAQPRVDLMLCGHTHGGQVNIPLLGPPLTPIRHKRYAAGLVAGPHCKVYVTRGLGMVGIPVRFNCRPELALITLRRG